MWDDKCGEIRNVNVNVNGGTPPLQPPRSMTWNSSRNFGRQARRQWRELQALKRRSFLDRLQSETTATPTPTPTNTLQPPVFDDVVLGSRSSEKHTRHRKRKAREIHTALLNTRDTITLVAMLVATFTYNAGVNPPGGVHQDSDNPLIGTAVAARKTAFRVFWVCNNIALFVSICIVLVMVSVIPFRRKTLLRIMSMAHRAVWVAASFMASAYVAAQFAFMHPPPQLRGFRWTSVILLSVCSGSLVAVSVAVGVMWIRHRFIKRKWQKQNPENDPENDPENGRSESSSEFTPEDDSGYITL